MSKEVKTIIFILVTITLNILAPILMIDMYKDYTAKSEIDGRPSYEYEVSSYVSVDNYVYQENFSKINFTEYKEGTYLYSCYFSPKEFDASVNNYAIFINDYICTAQYIRPKSIKCCYKTNFKDINKNTLQSMSIYVTFEFYSNYSYLLIEIKTDDITYFNGFKESPGFILTLSAVDYGSNKIEDNTTPDVEDNSCTAIYKVDDTVYALMKFEQNSALTDIPSAPKKDGYIFKGWSKNGVDVIDFTDYVMTSDVTFYAVFEKLCIASYKVDNSIIASYEYQKGSNIINVPKDPTKDNAVFAGWSKDGVNVIDPTTITITSDVTFKAIFKDILTLNFIANNVQYDTLTCIEGDTITTLPKEPTKEGYTFKGWSLNGTTVVDFNTYVLNTNKTFVAIFEEDVELATVNLVGLNSVRWLEYTPTGAYYAYHYIYNGTGCPVGTKLEISFSKDEFDTLTVEGEATVELDERNTTLTMLSYLVTINGDATIIAEKNVLELLDDEAVLYISGNYDYIYTDYAPTDSIYNGSVISKVKPFEVIVEDYCTESVTVTGGNVTKVTSWTDGYGVLVTAYTIIPSNNEVNVRIINKQTFATIFFNEEDFKVVISSPYISYCDNTYQTQMENLEEIHSGDIIPVGSGIYVQPLKDFSNIESVGARHGSTSNDKLIYGFEINGESVTLSLVA